ncbi:MAG: glycosyltransferase family 2 protein [Acidobacteriota bacterium]
MNARVAAIVPALDEVATIAAVVRGLAESVSVVVVSDDGSRDGTAEAARAAGAHVVARPTTGGKGRAIRTALAEVLSWPDIEWVLFIDADMQHRPDEAERLIGRAVESGADLVTGERQFVREQMPASRYYANYFGSRALSSFTGVPLRDSQCGFRVWRTSMLRRLPLRATGYDIETEMLIKVRRLGGTIISVPVSAVYGTGRSKLRPVRDTTRTCFRAVFYRYLESL